MFADMLWVPVTGSYTDRNGNTVARWPTDKLTFGAFRGEDGQQVLKWSSVRDEYCPDGRARFRTFEKQDPIQYFVEHAHNGVPIIRIRERVQTLDVKTS